MRLLADLDVDAPPSSLFPWVEDLSRYPEWFGLVRSAAREAAPSGDPGEPREPDRLAWDVVLVGRIGPLRRLKRLRMARVAHATRQAGLHRARFVRCELDGADHAAWELTVDVVPRPPGARLTMALYYSGRFWAPPLQHLLDHEIAIAKPRLAALAQGSVAAP